MEYTEYSLKKIIGSCIIIVHNKKMNNYSLVAQLVKSLTAMQETRVQSLGWENLLEKGEAAHSSILGLPWWLSW